MVSEIIMHEQGAPSVMHLVEVDLALPGPGEVQIEQTAIGLNYMDVYQRSGHYPMPLPSKLGLEAAGVVTAIGPDIDDIKIGDRVAYAGALGSYATHRNAPAARVVPLPDGVSDEVAAAVLMKGMTVEYLLNRTHKVGSGEDILFWAASGGVGQLAGQWGKHLGARMIGVTSGPQNCADILKLGYDAAIDRKSEDVAARVAELTNDKGVRVVYDSIGAASFEASIASLATYGLFVSFGATTGEAPAVAPGLLQKSGSLFFTRPTLADYVGPRADLLASAAAVFDMVEKGVLTVNINQRFALADVVKAHEALESGTTTGSTILVP
ncbi:quinone oxidoreductase family protein [Phaeobacter marinintestinus]|uniref:quinone oxidoreductase family protein n=1 Tax=Falsiphaeobacter marinintestinus TaxID=1492905 RepID=UPI0011B7E046|nr:quinone oxidoreductase [Phaeobacter marinintestinus]